MATTTAYRFAPAGSAEWIMRDEAYPLPVLGPHDVRIRVRACSMNYRDLIHAKRQMGRDFTGTIALSDGAGEVVARGVEVSRFAVGDRVAGCFFPTWESGRFEMRHHQSALGGSAPGMLAREVTLHENGCVKIPGSFSFEDAATWPCAAVTVWQSLVTRGRFQKGDTCLCLGTGGVSTFGLQFAKALGGQVVITSRSDEKLARARALGADHAINTRTNPEWDKTVWNLTGKRGVDHVIEVGGPGTLGQSMNAVAAGGQIHLVGVLTGTQPTDASLFPLVGRNVTMNGIYVGSRNDFETMIRFVEANALRPVVDRVFPFAEADAALKYLDSGSHLGKVVVTVD